MKKVYVLKIVLYSVIALLLTGGLIVGLFFGGAFSGNFNLGFNSKTFSYPLSNRQTFPVSGIKDISLTYQAESITLAISNSNEIVLEEYLQDAGQSHKAIITQTNGSLDIGHGQRNFLGITVFMRAPRVVLYVPSSFAGNLSLQSTSGSVKSEYDWKLESLTASSTSSSVKFQKLETIKDTDLSSTSGSVRANSINCGDSLTMRSVSGSTKVMGDITAKSASLHSTSGSVKVEGKAVIAGALEAVSNSGSVKLEVVSVGSATIKSTSGSVRVESFSGMGSFSSNSGSVQVNVAELKGDISLTSFSGGVRLGLPENSACHFSASVTSGSIRTPFDDALSFSRNGKKASGDVGSNAKINIECSTTSGSVRVEWI